jgi:hypothetical protein
MSMKYKSSIMNCNYVLYDGEPSLYNLVGLCVIRPESLSVKAESLLLYM